METFTKERFWAELDQIGEEGVRERIVTKRFATHNHKLALAEEWLARRERATAHESASAAAKVTADAARTNRMTMYAAWSAVGISVLALIVSLVK